MKTLDQSDSLFSPLFQGTKHVSRLPPPAAAGAAAKPSMTVIIKLQVGELQIASCQPTLYKDVTHISFIAAGF